jgi:hypothetical protein
LESFSTDMDLRFGVRAIAFPYVAVGTPAQQVMCIARHIDDM